MLDLVQTLLVAKEQAQETGASVTISLSLDDPRAKKLVAFARKLMLPTTRIRDSGLVTTTGIASAETTDEFLGKLRQVIGDELFSELMNDLGGQIEIAKGK